MLEWLRNNIIPLISGLLLLVSAYTTLLVTTNSLDIRLTIAEKALAAQSIDMRMSEVNNNRIGNVESLVRSLKEENVATSKALDKMIDRISSAEANSERTAVAVENLVKATTELTRTVSDLKVTVAKLEVKVDR